MGKLDKLKKYIDDNKKNGFDDKESKEISKLLNGLSEAELKKVVAFIKTKEINDPAKKSLQELLKRVHMKYSLESIEQRTESDIMKKFLEMKK